MGYFYRWRSQAKSQNTLLFILQSKSVGMQVRPHFKFLPCYFLFTSLYQTSPKGSLWAHYWPLLNSCLVKGLIHFSYSNGQGSPGISKGYDLSTYSLRAPCSTLHVKTVLPTPSRGEILRRLHMECKPLVPTTETELQIPLCNSFPSWNQFTVITFGEKLLILQLSFSVFPGTGFEGSAVIHRTCGGIPDWMREKIILID